MRRTKLCGNTTEALRTECKSDVKEKDYECEEILGGTSGQDGGIGKYTLPPCTTKRRTTTNLKTKNNQNCQEIKLYGNPTTKALNKKHSSRLVGGAEMGSQGGEDSQQGSSWRTGVGAAAARGVGGPTFVCR